MSQRMRWLTAAMVLGLLSAGSGRAQRIQHWHPSAISSPDWESHAAFDPITGDFWFVRSDPQFSGWHLLVAHCERGSWGTPLPAPIAKPGLEADPWFSPDGRTLWFISTRHTGSSKSADLDIYRVQRTAEGTWAEPEHLPAPVNSDTAEWFPRPAVDGWLYFGSRRPGGHGKDDIWRAREHEGRWIVENLGPGINTPASEFEFQPAPNGRWGLISTEDGLVRVIATVHGWQRDQLYPNQTGTEIGPLIAPDNSSFMFSRDAGHGASGELFIATTSAGVGWVPACPRTRSAR